MAYYSAFKKGGELATWEHVNKPGGHATRNKPGGQRPRGVASMWNLKANKSNSETGGEKWFPGVGE